MSRWFRLAATAMAMSVAGGMASAQSPFPSKPVHIFVPYAAGGAVDILTPCTGEHGILVTNPAKLYDFPN